VARERNILLILPLHWYGENEMSQQYYNHGGELSYLAWGNKVNLHSKMGFTIHISHCVKGIQGPHKCYGHPEDEDWSDNYSQFEDNNHKYEEASQ
jgi:hypothetical protein